MAVNDALVLIFSRNAFYKRLHYLVLAAFILSLLAIAFLFVVLLYLLRNPTHPLYFATDKVGRLIQIVPVDKPNMSNPDVIAWTIHAVQAANSYDFINFRSQLQGAQRYFTNYGWSNYMTALTASNNLLALINRKQIIIAEVIDQPKILVEGILSGSYAWKFQMPLLVTYSEPPYNDQSKFSNALAVTVIVARQPVLQGDRGLGIVQLTEEFSATPNNQPQQMSAPAMSMG